MTERPIYARICKNLHEQNIAVRAIEKLQHQFPLEVIVKPWKPKRSEQQNRYLWGIVYATIAQATGQEADDWHEFFLGEFFGWEEHELFGRKRLKPRERSSKQVKARFSEYIEFITARCAENGIIIPPPLQ